MVEAAHRLLPPGRRLRAPMRLSLPSVPTEVLAQTGASQRLMLVWECDVGVLTAACSRQQICKGPI